MLAEGALLRQGWTPLLTGEGIDYSVIDGLQRYGHEVTVVPPTFNHGFGRGQIIRRLDNGAYVAGSEPRSDGCAAGW